MQTETFLGAENRSHKLSFTRLAQVLACPVFWAIEKNHGGPSLFLKQVDGHEEKGVWLSPVETEALYQKLKTQFKGK